MGVSAIGTGALLLLALLIQNQKLLVLASLIAFAVFFMYGLESLDTVFIHRPPDNWRLVTDHWCTAAEMLIIAVALSFRLDVSKILSERGGGRGLDRTT